MINNKLLRGLHVHMIFIHSFFNVYHSVVRSFVRDKLSNPHELTSHARASHVKLLNLIL